MTLFYFHSIHAHEESRSLQWHFCSITHGVRLECRMNRGQGTATTLLVLDLHRVRREAGQCYTPRCYHECEISRCHGGDRFLKETTRSLANRNDMMISANVLCAGVAQLGEQQTEEQRILEVPCSIHGPGIFLLHFQSSRANIVSCQPDGGVRRVFMDLVICNDSCIINIIFYGSSVCVPPFFGGRAPKIPVPTRTTSAPSLNASSKSCDIPMLNNNLRFPPRVCILSPSPP